MGRDFCIFCNVFCIFCDAVFRRTRSVEERLNVDLDIIESGAADWKEFGMEIEQNVLAGVHAVY